MRALWKGWLSFGLINLPVYLYSGTREKELNFHLLHKKDNSPIHYARICKKDGQEVPWEDIIKGYQLQNGDIVLLADKDFENVNIHRTKTLDILDFTFEKEIDTIYYQKPYYLEPQKGAAKAYILLRESLKNSKKVGVVKFVLRNREHLGIIKPYGDYLVIMQLRFSHEILKHPDLEIPKTEKASAKEIALATQLIDQLTSTFSPSKYRDEYREEILRMIQQKAKGHRIKQKGKLPKKTKESQIVKVLKESLKKAKPSRRRIAA